MTRVILLCFFLLPGIFALSQPDRIYLRKALEAEKWLKSNRRQAETGYYWPVAPRENTVELNLYSGTSGIVLFYLELFKATDNKEFLTEAERGADYLIANFQSKPGYEDVGLYTGIAGLFWTVTKVYEVNQSKKYLLAAQLLLQSMADKAMVSGGQVTWRYNDVVYGSAGIGLALLNTTQIPGTTQLAIATGKGLANAGIEDTTGKKWYMDTAMVKRQYYMPNFSHGTAGVAYFFTKLFEKTGQREFLEYALDGAAHLETLENEDYWIYHHDKDEGQDLFYLSWCHGPAGTARLYYQLYKITGEEKWFDKMRIAANALMQCGIPQRSLPGFWNNAGPCCGTAGVAEFFLDMYVSTQNQEYLDFCKILTRDLIDKATRDGDGIKWVHAENRRSPDEVKAQTGLMQGAAGIGLWLLHLDAFERGRPFTVKLPDTPF